MNNSAETSSKKNPPYPGLSAFSRKNARYFYGRRKQLTDLLDLLGFNHFVAVIGESGSGKSSLVRAGLIPKLEAGFMVGSTPNWRTVEFRPGSKPIANLAESFFKSFVNEFKASESIPATPGYIQSAILRSPKQALPQLLNDLNFAKDSSLLIVIDQFEELFRYRKEINSHEAEKLIVLLLEAVKNLDDRIYVVITMRSDFIGDCSVFEGLPEKITESPFLVPRLDRNSLREAIIGPARLAKCDVEPSLVNHLCNAVSTEWDQLPVAQHVLMRLYDLRGSSNLLSLGKYNEIGGVEQALNNHANKVFEDLSAAEQRIAECLFRGLTEKTTEGNRIRRPTSVKDISFIFGLQKRHLISVVEKFAAPGNFFVISDSKPINSDSIIDIVHESLIRKWEKLQEWADDESDLAYQYRRICTNALERKYGDLSTTELLSGNKLQNAEQWRRKKLKIGPCTKAWCSRHWDRRWLNNFKTKQDSNFFELLNKFLHASSKQQKLKDEKSERKRLRQIEDAENRSKLAEEEKKRVEEDRNTIAELLKTSRRAEEEALVAEKIALTAKTKSQNLTIIILASTVFFSIVLVLWAQSYINTQVSDERHRADNYARHAKKLVDSDPVSALLLAFEAYNSYSLIGNDWMTRTFSRLLSAGAFESVHICNSFEETFLQLNELYDQDNNYKDMPELFVGAKFTCQADVPQIHLSNVDRLREEVCVAASTNLSFSVWTESVGYTMHRKTVTYPITCPEFPHGVISDAFMDLLIEGKNVERSLDKNSQIEGKKVTIGKEIMANFELAAKKLDSKHALKEVSLHENLVSKLDDIAEMYKTGNKDLENIEDKSLTMYLKMNKDKIENRLQRPLYKQCWCGMADEKLFTERSEKVRGMCNKLVEITEGNIDNNFQFERGLAEGLTGNLSNAYDDFLNHKKWVLERGEKPGNKILLNRINDALGKFNRHSTVINIDPEKRRLMQNSCRSGGAN